MTDTTLLDKLAQLGLPMMVPSADFDLNQTLAEVVKSSDLRLWEGFPVLLSKVARDYRLDYEKVLENLQTDEEKSTFHDLLLLSLALYEYHKLTFHWTNQLKARFSADEKSRLKQLKLELAGRNQFSLCGAQFHPERLKGMFGLYFEQDAGVSRQKKERFEELSLEYALSQVFSPKQKELFRKRLDGVPLTKTEKEYYSRAVKKKVVALANAELHRLAQQLLEY
jgi:hypothetical protein